MELGAWSLQQLVVPRDPPATNSPQNLAELRNFPVAVLPGSLPTTLHRVLRHTILFMED